MTEEKTDSLEHLEFDPPCQARETRTWNVLWLARFISNNFLSDCGKPGTWIANYPCCNGTGIFCAEHRVPAAGYPHCGHRWHHNWLTWKRI